MISRAHRRQKGLARSCDLAKTDADVASPVIEAGKLPSVAGASRHSRNLQQRRLAAVRRMPGDASIIRRLVNLVEARLEALRYKTFNDRVEFDSRSLSGWATTPLGAEQQMTIKLYAFTCGTLMGEFARLMEGGEGEITVPIPVFLIEHPKSRILFDTGLHPDCQHDPPGRLGTQMAELFRIGFRPGEEISARLEAIGRDPGKVNLIINSHFHFDHVGGNTLIPNATMLVQRREWEAGLDPDIAARHGYNPHDFDLGHKLHLIDGEYDVFGDGSVVCLPTHGHTPGHQSLRLRLDSGEVVLAADACYFCRTLRERRLPRYVHNRRAMLASLERLEALEQRGARIFFGHDPDFWQTVPQAPNAIQ
jgi:N-acyl homoserine lactone hydrolase